MIHAKCLLKCGFDSSFVIIGVPRWPITSRVLKPTNYDLFDSLPVFDNIEMSGISGMSGKLSHIRFRFLDAVNE